MFADEIRRQAEAAPRVALPAVAAALWRAYGEGQVSEAEAEALSALIEARKEATHGRWAPATNAAPLVSAGVVKRHGSRPRTDASLERRRRWVAAGRLPPAVAARFTPAEVAVLAVVAAEVAQRGDCRLAIGRLAAVAGVSETSVRNALREAARLGMVTVERRRLAAWRNDTNIVRIVAPDWTVWLRLARRGEGQGRAGVSGRLQAGTGGGCKFVHPTSTVSYLPGDFARRNPPKAAEGAGSQRR